MQRVRALNSPQIRRRTVRNLNVGTTHEVLNQSEFLEDFNRYTTDHALRDGVDTFGGQWATERLSTFGVLTGSADFISHAFAANENPPVLHTHSRTGERIDTVKYHPSYHHIMRAGYGHGIASLPYGPLRDRGATNVVRAALAHMAYATESGTMCPLSMTRACVPVLQRSEGAMGAWIDAIARGEYDERDMPADGKRGRTLGMSMTEKQGGSDVRANTTKATAAPSLGQDAYTLVGHKWFTSAPMSDAFLTLAYTDTPGGNPAISCFLVPRWLPGGDRNAGLRFMRLKSKLGDHSNASSEVEYHNAVGFLVGPLGKGVRSIIDMVVNTRLDCVIGSASLMRHGAATAAHHARQRHAFGAPLHKQPAMAAVLADLHLEAEASTWTALRIASAFDAAAQDDAAEAAFARLAVAVAKFYTCKRAPGHVAEALECLGGNGYVEDSGMPRAFRQSPLNGVWEGSGNVIALDVLRAMAKDPASTAAFMAELRAAVGRHPAYDAAARAVEQQLRGIQAGGDAAQGAARGLVEAMGAALQGSVLLRFAPEPVAEAFCAARFAYPSRFYGALPAGLPVELLVERAMPE